MDSQIPYLGQMLSILTAVVWAVAVIFFKKSGESVHPIALNFYKNLLAMLLLVPTIFIFEEGISRSLTIREYALFLASGALGIGLADTFFFRSLNLLGAGLSAIVDCLYSPSIIFLSFIWLGERLQAIEIVGVLLIISAVLTVSKSDRAGHLSRGDLLRGIFWGALAMGTMAVGIVMIKPLLGNAPFLRITEVRIIGGTLILMVIIAIYPGRSAIMFPRLNRRSLSYVVSGSFLGAYVSMVLWLAGMKYANASVAAALNQTSNIFIFIFAALFLKEPITSRRVLGIALGAAGVFLVTFGHYFVAGPNQ